MANGLPTEPTDSRWMPKNRTLILVGVGIQLFFVAVGGYLIRANRVRVNPPLLVSQVLIPEDMVYADSDVGTRKGKRLPPVDVQRMSVASADLVAKGQTLYAQNCASCHGESGKGDGAAGAMLTPKPRNLTSLQGWRRGTRLSDIFRTVTLGLPGTQMSAYEYLSPEDRFALTHFVMSLGSDHPAETRASLESLDREFGLSEGAGEPNIIPLSAAREKLISEAVQPAEGADSAFLAELALQEPRGAEVFTRVTTRAGTPRVAVMLASDSTWRVDALRLRQLITNGVPSNGFSPRVEQLSIEDMRALSRYLAIRFRKP